MYLTLLTVVTIWTFICVVMFDTEVIVMEVHLTTKWTDLAVTFLFHVTHLLATRQIRSSTSYKAAKEI